MGDVVVSVRGATVLCLIAGSRRPSQGLGELARTAEEVQAERDAEGSDGSQAEAGLQFRPERHRTRDLISRRWGQEMI